MVLAKTDFKSVREFVESGYFRQALEHAGIPDDMIQKVINKLEWDELNGNKKIK